MVGTDVILAGIEDGETETARQLFLEFSAEQMLESTRLGQIFAGGRTLRRELT